jgi:CrcB protein
VLARWLPHQNARLLVITGFLGGYTTYSTFAFESQTLWERDEKAVSLGYMASTLLAGFVAVWLGVALARGLTTPKGERATPGDSVGQVRVEEPPAAAAREAEETT